MESERINCAAILSHCKEIQVPVGFVGLLGDRLSGLFAWGTLKIGAADRFMDRYGRSIFQWQDEFANFLDEIKELDAGH